MKLNMPIVVVTVIGGVLLYSAYDKAKKEKLIKEQQAQANEMALQSFLSASRK